MKNNIRKAIMDDCKSIASILKISREEAMPYLPVLHTPQEDLEFIQNIVFKECTLYVCEDDNKILGFIAFNNTWIEHLYLLPNHQRQGIGKALLDKAKSYSNHYKLWTFIQNQAAVSFYEKNGFLKIKETDGSENEEKEPDALYEWKA